MIYLFFFSFFKFQLKNKVKQTNTVRWLKLNKRVQDPKAGSVCVVAGWGTSSNKKPKMSNVLMSANVTVIDRFKCNSHQHYNMTPVITNSMICASSDGKNPTDTCAVRLQHAGSEMSGVTLRFNCMCDWLLLTSFRGILEAHCCATELWWASRPLGGSSAVTSRIPACIPSSLKNTLTGCGRL